VTEVALTGSGGFVGWHTRAALREQAVEARAFAVGEAYDRAAAVAAVTGVGRMIHLAGVNRGTDDEVRLGNIQFAEQVADAIRRSEQPPSVIVYADSTQVGNGTAYGDAKQRAADILAAAAEATGSTFMGLRLPNLFGEHGRPFYNAVTSTFSHLLAEGGVPKVDVDRELTLLHAQDVADLLIGTVSPEAQGDLEERETVSGLLARLTGFDEVYRRGEIPDVATRFASIAICSTPTGPTPSLNSLLCSSSGTRTLAAPSSRSSGPVGAPANRPSRQPSLVSAAATTSTGARSSASRSSPERPPSPSDACSHLRSTTSR